MTVDREELRRLCKYDGHSPPYRLVAAVPDLLDSLDIADRRIAELERPHACSVCGACETHGPSRPGDEPCAEYDFTGGERGTFFRAGYSRYLPTMQKRVEVHDCTDCPFAEIASTGGGYCRAVAGPDNIIWLSREPPSWCPLRQGDLLVTLNKG